MLRVFSLILGVTGLTVAAQAQVPDTLNIRAKISTQAVESFANDVAIWVHPDDPAKSLIFGTDFGTYPNGGLFVWNLDGTQQNRLTVSHPEQVEVEYGMQLGDELVDIVVITMRDHDELRVYKIDPESLDLTEITTDNLIFSPSPYGLGLYKNPANGEISAIVSSRVLEGENQVHQLALHDDGSGGVAGTEVRSSLGESDLVSAILVDDDLGYLYLVDETSGIFKFHADPELGDAVLASLATEDDINGARQGLALYACSDSSGYLLLSVPDEKSLLVYPRQDDAGQQLLARIEDLDGVFGNGLAATNHRLDATFSEGLLAWHDSTGNRFQLYGWEDVAQAFLNICTDTGVPTGVRTNVPSMPVGFRIEQNYPNPFNPETTIKFEIAAAARVKLSVFNVLGEHVRTLLEENLPPGVHARSWDGTDEFGRQAASGIYIYKVQVGQYTESHRMVLFR